MTNHLLSIRNLSVSVGQTNILDQVDLDIAKGKILGIVGGSGSGKTTLGLAILRLLPSAMTINSGHILFEGDDLMQLSMEQVRPVRGGEIGMVFQEPMLAFDPLFTIGAQLDETLKEHTCDDTVKRRNTIEAALRLVEIDDPRRIYTSYPHQLSGGLCQRAMIAQAMICSPQLIIADEPTSSLDVIVAFKIIELLRMLNRTKGIAVMLIAHDLGMVAHLADEVAVMHKSKKNEKNKTAEIIRNPKNGYTKALLEAY
mgnify:CR=1 FL=1